MSLLALYLFLVSKASTDYVSLVADVDNALEDCLAIVETTSNYVHELHSPDDVRRREDEELDIDDVLGACTSIVESVDTYRVNYDKQWFMSLSRWPGNSLLNALLSSVSKKVGEILYIASSDGEDVSQFHSACDGQGPTISVFLSSNGAVFGGYTDQSWGVSSWQTSSTSFVFRLRPTFERYDIVSGQEDNAVYNTNSHGPMFGYWAIRIEQNPLSNYNSYTEPSYTGEATKYAIPSDDLYVLNDGERNFKLVEYFVMEAVDA